MPGDAGFMFGLVIFLIIFFFLIITALSRWIFRVNDAISRLDKIILLLEGNKEGK